MKKQNYLDRTFAELTWDAGFKATFRDPDNKDALILLLNAFLPKERRVVSVEFIDREQNGLSVENKTNIYDLHCKDQDGNDFIVEMQKEDIGNYLERCLAYAIAAYLANIDKGDYNYNSAVPVYLISFIVERSKDPRINEDNGLINQFGIAKKFGRFLENQLLNLIFVKLYEVKRLQTPDKNTPLKERFSWLMMNLPNMKHDPSPEIIGECGAMVKAAKIAGFDKNKKLNYVTNMDKEHLERAIRYQNRIEGIAEGIAKGKAEGKAEGIAEGETKKARETAKKLIAKGMPTTDIAEVTGLTPEEIQAL